ncbi:DUF86 domain-containing protein [Paenibacillus yanchengensis]|uniref:DUF86 domain-containing protein n=1 Tax=Paenibacillus yanchengensis TaxID=2035833 RepID=A0ABW4YNL3_9BACL
MYFVNVEQIAVRLAMVENIVTVLKQLTTNWQGDTLQSFAQERALHLAAEIVTDVGNYIIDGFIMRDASSYEDIVDIIGEEGVYPEAIHDGLMELVLLRKPLVQQYFAWPRAELHPLSDRLPEILLQFKQAVEQYIEREL